MAIGDGATSLAASTSTLVLAQGDPVQALVIPIVKGRTAAGPVGKVRARVPIGPGVGVVALTPDGSTAWIGHRDRISVLALATATIERTIDLPGQVRKIVLIQSRAWVLSEAGTISVLDAVSGQVLARRVLPEPVSDIAVGPGGSFLLAALPQADAVQEMNPTDLHLLGQASAGTDPAALVLSSQDDAVIALGAKAPAYLSLSPLRYIGTVIDLGPASMAATAAASRRAWIVGGKAAWIVDLGIRPSVSVQVEPTKSGLQDYPAIATLKGALDSALAGDIRILGSGTMEYDGESGTAPMRLEIVRSGSTTYRDDGTTITYISATEVCTKPTAAVTYSCRPRAGGEPDLVEQFRLAMPWERSGTAPPAFGSLDALSATGAPIDVGLLFARGPVVGAASGTTSYRLVKGAFSIVEAFGGAPSYEITTRLSKPVKPLPQDLGALLRD